MRGLMNENIATKPPFENLHTRATGGRYNRSLEFRRKDNPCVGIKQRIMKGLEEQHSRTLI